MEVFFVVYNLPTLIGNKKILNEISKELNTENTIFSDDNTFFVSKTSVFLADEIKKILGKKKIFDKFLRFLDYKNYKKFEAETLEKIDNIGINHDLDLLLYLNKKTAFIQELSILKEPNPKIK